MHYHIHNIVINNYYYFVCLKFYFCIHSSVKQFNKIRANQRFQLNYSIIRIESCYGYQRNIIQQFLCCHSKTVAAQRVWQYLSKCNFYFYHESSNRSLTQYCVRSAVKRIKSLAFNISQNKDACFIPAIQSIFI